MLPSAHPQKAVFVVTFSLPSARPAVLAGLLAASVVLTGCSELSAVIDQVVPERTGVHTLIVGECFNNTVTSLASHDAVVDVPQQDCTLAHDNEVIASIPLDDDVFPGEDAVSTRGIEACLPEFEQFIGVSLEEAGTLKYDSFVPSAASWQLGDREILCYVYDSAAQSAYTLRDQGAERTAASAGADAVPEGDS